METITRKQFLTNRDETGREVHTFYETGKSFYVEYIEPKGHRTNWGSYNPSTGNIENKKGAGKYKGGVPASDSMITIENGFSEEAANTIHPGGSVEWNLIKAHEKWKKETGWNA